MPGAAASRQLLGVELLAQAGFVFGADLVLAGVTGLLVLLATSGVGSLAAVGRRSLLLDALAESRAGLALAFLVGHFARFALLWISCLGAVEVLHLLFHALAALRSGTALAGFGSLCPGITMGIAGGWIGCLTAISRCACTG